LPTVSRRRWPPTRLQARSSTRWGSFYRKAYLRWIDGTTRRPDLRAARADLLAVRIKTAATIVRAPKRPADHLLPRITSGTALLGL
jgi:hypothetical protein